MPALPFTATRLAQTLLGLGFVLHSVVGGMHGLSVDEAHYLLYALRPALSYFDHPPLVGWVQWPLVALDAPVVVLRLVPGLVWLASGWLVYQLACDLCGSSGPTGSPPEAQAGLAAVLVFVLTPMFNLLGIALVPDSLLVLLSLALLRQTLRLMRQQAGHRPQDWLLLGLLLGLAGLAKYTAILAALAVAACLLGRHGLQLLRQPWLWAAVLTALAVVAPVFIWNAQHQWLSFDYQIRHGAGAHWQARNLLIFGLLQALAYGPLMLWAWQGWRLVAAPAARLSALFFVLPFGVLAYLSGGGSGLPHWTAPAWAALAPLAGIGLSRAFALGRRRWMAAAAGFEGLTVALLLATMLTGLLPWSSDKTPLGAADNPFADLHGWELAGERARQLARQEGLSSVAVQHWTLGSRLGWYARPLPVQVLDQRTDQFDLWAAPLAPGAGTLLLDWSLMPFAAPLGPNGFEDCQLLDTLEPQRLGRATATFRFYACHHWQGAAGARP